MTESLPPASVPVPAHGTRYYPVGGGSGEGSDLHEVLQELGTVPAGEPVIGMVWAQTADGVIGRDGGMPWHLPEDLAHFKATTAGHPVIMGRRTWESFPAKFRPLPGRTNIIVSSSTELADEAAGVAVAGSLDEALQVARTSPGSDEIWIIGGAQLYEAAVEVAHTAVVTVIDTETTGDTFAPLLGPDWTFTGVSPASGWSTAGNGTNYRIALWTRDTADDAAAHGGAGNSDVTDSDVRNQHGSGPLA